MHIVSLHSQKGGTGKTSIALSLAIEAQRRNLKTLFVDADLSGTSVKDSIHLKVVQPGKSISDYFRSPQVKNPLEYITTAQLTDIAKGNTQQELSVLLGDAQTGTSLMPLVYKENHSQFLGSRIESLIEALAVEKQVQVIIFDNSPGHWGLGRSIIETVTRGHLRDNGAIKFSGNCILVSSVDLNDIVSCLHLRETDAKVKYHHIVNRSPHGKDLAANTAQIASSLDQKGTQTNEAGYQSHAQKLRSSQNIVWACAEDPVHLVKTYRSHVKGIHVPENIGDLATLLNWSPA